jgi:NADPH:quinone reductase-like Zn-dependent oxidoreductase
LVPSVVAGWIRRADFVTFVAKPNGDDMATLAEMIDAGQVRTVVEETFGFEKLPAALTRFRQGHVAGKIVVEH